MIIFLQISLSICTCTCIYIIHTNGDCFIFILFSQFYRKPLLALTSTSQAVISETDVNTIFYRVEDLHTLHSTLHEMLEALLPDWGMHSCVGGFFLELVKRGREREREREREKHVYIHYTYSAYVMYYNERDDTQRWW